MRRLFEAIESKPDDHERKRVEALLRQPATKLDVATALVIQAQLNTALASSLSDLYGGRGVTAEALLKVAELQVTYGYEMLDFLTDLFDGLKR